GNATAQYNLGLMYAKGSGAPKDDVQALAWFRKAAEQGELNSQFKLGVAYENGEGVAKDDILAYAHYAIAARSGNKQYAEYRDEIAAKLNPSQLNEAPTPAACWQLGKSMPVRIATANGPANTKAP